MKSELTESRMSAEEQELSPRRKQIKLLMAITKVGPLKARLLVDIDGTITPEGQKLVKEASHHRASK